MHAFTSAVILIYAAILVAGGVIGWRVSGSRISLTSSLISAFLLTVAYRITLSSPLGGYALAAFVSVALEAVFALRLSKTKKFMPSGMMLILSGVVTVILAWSIFQAWVK